MPLTLRDEDSLSGEAVNFDPGGNDMNVPFELLSQMTVEQEAQFWEQFEHELDSDTGEAAKAHLAAGRPIYYMDPAYPDQIVKEYPDGRRELVRFDWPSGAETVVKEL
jgi:hypothetical protein